MVLNLRSLVPLLALAMLLISGCNKEKDTELPTPESPVYTKEVSFRIFTETDYSEARWEDSKMNLTVQLRRQSTALPKEVVVLDTTFGWMPFQKLPLKGNPLRLEKQLREINKDQDVLILDVKKVVSINGYETVFQHDQPLDHAKQHETLEIKL
jgi:hypothetical protein